MIAKNHERPTFFIILIESALEQISTTSIKKTKKRIHQKGKKILETPILDVSIHNHLMHDMSDKNKRGRPDIIHTALLLALGSRLNKRGGLRIYVHTRNNEIISFDPKVRIPRNYNRFKGLMNQLFEIKKIPPNSSETLISIKKQTLEDFIHQVNPDLTFLFTEKGVSYTKNDILNLFLEKEKIVFLIGGFPHGDFSQDVFKLATTKISIFPESLDTLQIISYTIHLSEELLKLG